MNDYHEALLDTTQRPPPPHDVWTAEAVRAWMVSRGIDPTRAVAVEHVGGHVWRYRQFMEGLV